MIYLACLAAFLVGGLLGIIIGGLAILDGKSPWGKK